MNDLRVYTMASSAGADSDILVFYSRRADGPFYRWTFDATRQKWRSARVDRLLSRTRALSLFNLKDIPTTLQEGLAAHYLD